MKQTLGKKIVLAFFVPFIIIFGLLSALFFSLISSFSDRWAQLEINAIADVNTAILKGSHTDSSALNFEGLTFGITEEHESVVAVFDSDGKVLYTPNPEYADSSIDDLSFANMGSIRGAFMFREELLLPDEFCSFSGERSMVIFKPFTLATEGSPDSATGGSPVIYVSIPLSVFSARLLPIFVAGGTAIIVVAVAILFLLSYVIRKVSRPMRQLTNAADAISRGDYETEIGYFSEAEDEITVLSKSLHRMVERFRIHSLEMQQAQRETSMELLIMGFANASNDMNKVLGGMTTMFSEYFRAAKTTIVYIDKGIPTSFSFNNSHNSYNETVIDTRFAHKEQLDVAVRGRKIAFLNTNTIKAQNLSFLEPTTLSACIVPLKDDLIVGYLVLESDLKESIYEGDELILMYVGEVLGEWLKAKRWEKQETPAATSEPVNKTTKPIIAESQAPALELPLDKLKAIDGLDVDGALKGMGGLYDVYEKSVKLTVRLLPQTMVKLDQYILDENWEGFRIEVHGLKGALRNIGAALSTHAAKLEMAVHEERLDYCKEHYPTFKEEALNFAKQLDEIFAGQKEKKKEKMDKSLLLSALERAKIAASRFDATQAVDELSAVCDFCFDSSVATDGSSADELLEKVMFSLEEFDCDGALTNIKKLEEILSETQQ
ncbi:MAG: HAMP domain-containing protein [Oscillospiraceae bacterium]|nr:HAMP domain-containing protein [Oscillospiraceae bacterium]